ncbi:MAG: hypothetical protein GY745_00015 [Actinomycetia bacterium]|nr:hypothetical protein [Actinomycetes bacterium]
MSRRVILGVVAVVAVLSGVVGWFAGQQIRSPADVAADAEPPEASLITVPVEQRTLSSNVVIRGQVEFSESSDLSVSGSADGVAIITRLTKEVGDELSEGDVAVEVAGRPVIVLEGELPVFRSLTPTLEGPDVRQLEEALLRLGHDPGDIDGVYDSDTEEAVTSLYRDAGYSADEPSADELERVEIARKAVRAAREAVTRAEQEASSGLPESTRLELDRQVANAQTALADALTARDAAVAAAQAVTAGAVADREAAEVVAAAPDADADDAAGLVAAVKAQAAAEAGEAQVIKDQDALVANSEIDVKIAEASRAEAIAAAQNTGSAEGLAQAREALAQEQKNLDRLDAETGVTVPASELIFLPSLPAEVQLVRVSIGDIAQGPVMTVTGSGVKITSSVSASDRSLLSVGVEAVMEDDDLGLSIPARVVFVADNPGGVDLGSDRYAVRLEAIGELPDDAVNQNLRITIPFASTDGEVLAVPMAALSAGADGSARVEVERADGSVEIVTVAPGLNARSVGLVEIAPVEGELSAGDRVVVGRNQPAGGSDGGAEQVDEGSEEGESE